MLFFKSSPYGKEAKYFMFILIFYVKILKILPPKHEKKNQIKILIFLIFLLKT